ncbi:MAG: VRR-NUC domain-containing protein [Thiomicrorhabdus sp.]|jgi:hypothetical protein|nr:VRR-NUC domain-containing protein [Thiomicrorhabdus sp.]
MSEYDEQKALVQWMTVKKLAFAAVPNENNMSFLNKKVAMIQGAKAKASGKRKGFPDMLVFVPGLVIVVEMKNIIQKGKTKPVTSPEQTTWIKLLIELGHPAKVCYGWIEAKQFIELHLKKVA